MKKKIINILIVIMIILGILFIGCLRYKGMIDTPDVISFAGSVFGAIIGVAGALYVVYEGKKLEKEKNIEKLMQMFKHIYIWLYPRHYIGASYSVESLSDPIVPLIYDEKWKEYIIEIGDTHHKRFLLSWFYTLESLKNKKEFIARLSEEQLEEAKKILEFYNMYDNEVKAVENSMMSKDKQALKKHIINRKSDYFKIIDEKFEAIEQQAEKYEYEQEDEISSAEDQIDKEIKDAISKFDKEILDNNIYKF